MKILTKAEEDVMQILWSLEKGFVRDIIDKMPEPKPAYNTVSTIVRILEEKSFVGHNAYGKSYEYYPLVKKEEYTNKFLGRFISRYFGGSFEKMVSFFANENDISLEEMDEIMQNIKKNKDD